ncbi:hypothetical protein G6F46_008044 [Rhizopus delemar]|nr:hypothetical protein G6F55_005977 [Rhizopus delemar]KAG1543361.1 hypothetical protein G6F51_006724 [Rhizopus arrhizus]KAG1494958.1 hypothetical protein G6F54_007510 [Rhizopus delemar]KAG1508948.1 hypothetical protein G6F53_007811 [Rhizopus delemar]KAG1527529.1 hypothetical protein G6F52_001452 [Rhizopus delemar]
MYAIVRDVPTTFDKCVTTVDNTVSPIDISLAKKQYEAYVNALREHVDHIVEIPADPLHPDCCFIEDTAVVVQDTAVVNCLGAESRRKEISAVEKALRKIPVIKDVVRMDEIDPQATLDGGDVLYTGEHLFVGLSHRTNQRGADVLKKVFSEKCPVYTIHSLLAYNLLHFKCIVTMLNNKTLLVYDHKAGLDVVSEIEGYTKDWYNIIKIPEQIPSNIVSLSNGKVVIYQQGLKKTDNSTRPRMRHNKSNSTTSITKSSVILSSSYQLAKPTTANDDIIPQKRKTTITFAVPNNKNTISQKEQEETSSISSSSLISMSSLNSSISSLHSSTAASFILIHNKNGCSVGGDGNGSTAVDALTSLASASAKNSVVTDFDMPSIHLQERKESTEPVLTENIAETIRPYIPRRYRVASSWKLLYSLDQHGVSLFSLYSSTKDYEGPCIMIIKDADKQIYGAYLSSTLKCQNNMYYGTGECFLWKLTSEKDYKKEEHALPKIKVFPWTGKNDYMILCNTDFIAIGGGDGKFGLWLNSDLEKGYSTNCPTFDNECLALKQQFQCMEMEVWGLTI